MEQRKRREYLIRRLMEEDKRRCGITMPQDTLRQKQQLRALMNVRMPAPMDETFLSVQDAYLQEEIRLAGVTNAGALDEREPGICLWQGDITLLRCDAIVNAANSGMTGCYVLGHACIDNCIHTRSGIQLRLHCARMMQAQGHEEETGGAKITPAWNLPCRYILHTVGPIVRGELTAEDERLLAGCYRSCLTLAEENGVGSVAFCCISTGVFGYPAEAAARTAVDTVRRYRDGGGRIRRVIFNVFKDSDRAIYERILR